MLFLTSTYIVAYVNCYVHVYVCVNVFLVKFLDELDIKYSRSSGPGGQNVNKGIQNSLILLRRKPLLKMKCHTLMALLHSSSSSSRTYRLTWHKLQ